MPNVKSLKKRINSIRDTKKITNAMYLIASAKLQRARRELDNTRPYFNAIKTEIKRIFRIDPKRDSKYFYPASGERDLPGAYAYLVITADKGLSGAYNMNVIKTALGLMKEHSDNELYVVGQYGRYYFASHDVPIKEKFLYTAQNPTFARAREICDILMEGYESGRISKIFVIYTDFVSGMKNDVCVTRLLPFHRADFLDHAKEKEPKEPFEFSPSIDDVFNNIIPSYVAGFIFSALIDSYCCEQSSRMTAMKTANDNAAELLEKLSLQYNHLRQAEITSEITEISAGCLGKENSYDG